MFSFIEQPNILMDLGVHPSLYSKYHHQIIYSKLILKIKFSPPYTHKNSNYNRSESDLINRSIEDCNWPSLLLGKNLHQQVEIFDKILLKIF